MIHMYSYFKWQKKNVFEYLVIKLAEITKSDLNIKKPSFVLPKRLTYNLIHCLIEAQSLNSIDNYSSLIPKEIIDEIGKLYAKHTKKHDFEKQFMLLSIYYDNNTNTKTRQNIRVHNKESLKHALNKQMIWKMIDKYDELKTHVNAKEKDKNLFLTLIIWQRNYYYSCLSTVQASTEIVIAIWTLCNTITTYFALIIKERWAVVQCLDGQWLPNNTILMPHIVRKGLLKFKQRIQFKAALSALLCQIIDQSQILEIEKFFKKFDTNNDGLIAKDEFLNDMKFLTIHILMAIII